MALPHPAAGGRSRHEVSLGEGDTPLVAVPRLARELGAAELWIKDESRNPTWSFKDRNAAVTVSKAREFGARTLVASTSGNHGAAVAAYAARAGLGCVVLTYPGIPAGNRILMQASGARLVVTTPEGRRMLLRQAVGELGWHPATNATDPPTNSAYGHEGYKTIAYELVDQLGGRPPDLVVIPTAYAEGLFGIWKGFDELRRLGRLTDVPRMLACEPKGGPLGVAYRSDHGAIAVVPRTATVARGIDVTANSYIGVAALVESGGLVVQASDDAILTAQRDLAADGFFVEPASAAGLACLRIATERQRLPSGLSIVVVNTSSGLKSLETLLPLYEEPVIVEPTLDALNPARVE
ncbi:MAG: pyridoxal-phosphate dependent enzyme [Egibacteraceae bacterium]